MTASLAADGSYRIRTHQANGLPPGSYRVAVTPGATMKDDTETPLAGKNPPPPPDTATSPIPEKYRQSDESPLKAEVKAGSNPPFNFDLSE